FISPVIANVLFLSLASLIFVLLAKCDVKEILCFSLMMSLLHSTHIYAKTGMVEALRVSVTIIAVGAIIRFWREEKVSKIYKYAVLPAILVLTSQISILLAVLFPVYVYLLLREHRFGKTFMCDFVLKTLIIGSSSFAFLVLNYIPLYLTSCAYPYSFGKLVHTLTTAGFAAAVKEMLNVFFSGFLGLDPTILISKAATFSEIGIFVWPMLLWWLVVGFTVYMIIKNKKEHSRFFCKENEPLFVIFILNTAFIFGLNLMYGGTAHERQILIVAIISVLLGVFLKYKQYLYIFVIVGVLSFPVSWTLDAALMEMHRAEHESVQYYIDKAEEFSNLIVLDENAENKWDNTVACYNDISRFSLSLPKGAGLQFMFGDLIIPAKYAALYDDAYRDTALMDKLVENGYSVIYSDQFQIILMRK
ncbi:MAG: hypothetical protein RSD39_02940, partial [Oscillospiraceae bacterium]